MRERLLLLLGGSLNLFCSVKGSRRRATKNHKSKAELLNQEEGEGDLAVGKINILSPLSLSIALYFKGKPQEHTDAILSCISVLPDSPLLLSCPLQSCTFILVLHILCGLAILSSFSIFLRLVLLCFCAHTCARAERSSPWYSVCLLYPPRVTVRSGELEELQARGIDF